MSNRLEEHLFSIEKALSGDAAADPSINNATDRLEWHLTKIEQLLNAAGVQSGKLDYEVVDTLPAIGEAGIVYFVRVSTKKNQNKSDEYLWVNGEFEKIGSTDIDLSSYATKKELTDAIAAIELKEGPKGDAGTSATHSWNGTKLTITSASGTSSADLKGPKGDDGVSASHSWNGTTLTITSSSGTSSADLKGQKGDTGKSAYTAAKEGGFQGTESDFGTKLAEILTLLTSITEEDEGKVLKVVNGKLTLVALDEPEATE